MLIKRTARIFILIFCLNSFGFAKCYYVPCDSQIQSAKSSSKSQISSSFDEVERKLRELESVYQEELNELISTNELLRKQIQVSKNTVLKLKELVFLLKQSNSLKANAINQDAIKDK